MSNLTKSFIIIIVCAITFYTIAFFFGQKKTNEAVAFEWEKNVKVYFVDRNQVRETSCEANSFVERTVINAETLGPGAIEALIMGLTAEENEYLVTSINSKTNMLRFELIDGVAYVDFDKNLNDGIGGSCMVVSIKTQIENTLLDLPEINQVVISVEGETEGILEP